MNKRLMLVLFLMLLAAPLYAQEYGELATFGFAMGAGGSGRQLAETDVEHALL